MMLARHADALLWAGRYLERAETTVRVLDVASRTIMELWPEDARVESQQLVRALGIVEEFGATDTAGDFADVRRFLLADARSRGSIAHAIAALRDNLRTVQDRVPVELWEEVNRVHLELRSIEERYAVDDQPHDLFVSIRRQCQAISGVLAEAMLRDEGHAMLSIGRCVERAMLAVHLMATTLTHPTHRFDAERLLRSTTSLQAYRRLRHHDNSPTSIVEFLLLEPLVPRTVRACVDRVEVQLATVEAGRGVLLPAAQQVGLLRASLMYGDMRGRLETDAVGLLNEVQDQLSELALQIHAALVPPLDAPVLHAQYIRPGRANR